MTCFQKNLTILNIFVDHFKFTLFCQRCIYAYFISSHGVQGMLSFCGILSKISLFIIKFVIFTRISEKNSLFFLIYCTFVQKQEVATRSIICDVNADLRGFFFGSDLYWRYIFRDIIHKELAPAHHIISHKFNTYTFVSLI